MTNKRLPAPESSSILGMIVDRSSFDDENSDTDEDLLNVESRRIITKEGKIRRKLRWKPAAFRMKNNPPPKRSDSASIGSLRTTHSNASLHTFYSTETPVKSNQTNKKPIPMGRPHYRDTFQGVTTISNEGHSIRSRTQEAPSHSSTLLVKYDFESLDGESYRPDDNGLGPNHKHTTKVASQNSAFTSSDNLSEFPPSVKQRLPDPPSTLGIVSYTISPSSKQGRPPKAPMRWKTFGATNHPINNHRQNFPPMASPKLASNDYRMPDMPLTSIGNRMYEETEHSSVLPRLPSEITQPTIASLHQKDDPPTTFEKNEKSDPICSAPPKVRNHSVPVDVDDGSFVDAERHLKAIHDMAAEHLAHGEYAEALEVFEEIFRGQLERYGADHYRVGTALHNIGIVHLKSRNYVKAVELCKLAVQVRKQALPLDHLDVAVSLAQLGVAYLECRNYREALTAFREALAIRKNALGPKHPKVGKLLNNIGCTLYELEEFEGARLTFQEALDIQRESLRQGTIDLIGDSKSSSNQLLLSIAATLCNLGSIQVRWSKFAQATLAFEEALLVSNVFYYFL
jgi:Tetratricopeptide repeat